MDNKQVTSLRVTVAKSQPPDSLPALGTYLATLRTQRGLSQMRLAAATGVGQSQIQRIEAGSQLPNLVHAVALIVAVGGTLDDLPLLIRASSSADDGVRLAEQRLSGSTLPDATSGAVDELRRAARIDPALPDLVRAFIAGRLTHL